MRGFCQHYASPPIAIPAIFASQISGGKYMKTSVEAAIAGLAGFLLPFMIVFVPGLTFDFSNPLFVVLSFIACVLIFIGLQPAIVGYFLRRLDLKERLGVLLAPLAFLIFLYHRNPLWFVVGFAVLSAFVAWQMRVRRLQSVAPA